MDKVCRCCREFRRRESGRVCLVENTPFYAKGVAQHSPGQRLFYRAGLQLYDEPLLFEHLQAADLDCRLAAARQGLCRINLHPKSRCLLFFEQVVGHRVFRAHECRLLGESLADFHHGPGLDAGLEMPARSMLGALLKGDALTDQFSWSEIFGGERHERPLYLPPLSILVSSTSY